MSTWSEAELTAIDSVHELQLESLRDNGSPREPVVMWVVRLDDGLYVRAVGGRSSSWFKGTQRRHAGRIRAGEVAKDVAFTEPSDELADTLDAAYRSKYSGYAKNIVDHITSPAARAAALRIDPAS